MAKYYDEDYDVSTRKEDELFKETYQFYFDLLEKAQDYESFDSIMDCLRRDETIDVDIRTDVLRKIRIDISDCLIVRPTISIDDINK